MFWWLARMLPVYVYGSFSCYLVHVLIRCEQLAITADASHLLKGKPFLYRIEPEKASSQLFKEWSFKILYWIELPVKQNIIRLLLGEQAEQNYRSSNHFSIMNSSTNQWPHGTSQKAFKKTGMKRFIARERESVTIEYELGLLRWMFEGEK